ADIVAAERALVQRHPHITEVGGDLLDPDAGRGERRPQVHPVPKEPMVPAQLLPARQPRSPHVVPPSAPGSTLRSAFVGTPANRCSSRSTSRPSSTPPVTAITVARSGLSCAQLPATVPIAMEYAAQLRAATKSRMTNLSRGNRVAPAVTLTATRPTGM